MNRSPWHVGPKRRALVAYGTGEIEQTTKHLFTDWHLEGAAGGSHRSTAPQSRC